MINSEKVTLGVEIWGERDFLISFSNISTYIYCHISYIHITFKNYALQNIKLKITDKESEKVGLKLNSQKTKIMASGPITSWQIVRDFIIFLGSKITADGDCSHEIKRRLLLGRKVMTNLDSILKSRHITCQQRSI